MKVRLGLVQSVALEVREDLAEWWAELGLWEAVAEGLGSDMGTCCGFFRSDYDGRIQS